MQTPDSRSVADKRGKASARGHGVGGGAGPHCRGRDVRVEDSHGLSSRPPGGMPCLTPPQHQYGGVVDSGPKEGGRSLWNGCVRRALAAALSLRSVPQAAPALILPGAP